MKKQRVTHLDKTITKGQEETNAQVAGTILEQLGGHQFLVMTGINDYGAHDDGVSMKLRRNASKANYLAVTLDRGTDLYTLEFIRVHGASKKTIKEHIGVYADQLAELFTATTGMYTSL